MANLLCTATTCHVQTPTPATTCHVQTPTPATTCRVRRPEALGDPDIHAIVVPRMSGVRAGFAEIALRCQADGRLPAHADSEAMAQVMFALVPGFVVQRLMLADVDPSTYVAAFRALTE